MNARSYIHREKKTFSQLYQIIKMFQFEYFQLKFTNITYRLNEFYPSE